MDRSDSGERGVLVVYLAFGIPVILGFLGLIFDVGTSYALRRELQIGADAAAIAAMQEIRKGNETGFHSAALEDAYLNGFEPVGATQIDVNRPPSVGPRMGDTNFVEVVIRTSQEPVFMQFFNKSATQVTARAVAGIQPNGACVYALNPSSAQAFKANGTADVDLGTCGILVNSSHGSAAVTNGGGTVTAGNIGVVGDYSGSGFTPTPETGVAAFEDPLGDLPAPASIGCDHTGGVDVKTPLTLYPGIYCGGINVSAGGVAYLQPGMYVMKGGGFQSNGGRIQGDGITIYLTAAPGKTYGPADFGGNTSSEISAPLDGVYKGVLFFQDRTISSHFTNRFRGTSDTHFKGVLYFPTTDVVYEGNAASSGRNTLIVADEVQFLGTSQLASLGSEYMPRALSQARMME